MNSFFESLEDLVAGRAFLPVYAINAQNMSNSFENPLIVPLLLGLIDNQDKNV